MSHPHNNIHDAFLSLSPAPFRPGLCFSTSRRAFSRAKWSFSIVKGQTVRFLCPSMAFHTRPLSACNTEGGLKRNIMGIRRRNVDARLHMSEMNMLGTTKIPS